MNFLNFTLEKIKTFHREGCFSLFIGAQPNVVVFRADHMEKPLTNDANTSKGYSYSHLHPWLGQGL